MRSQLSHKATTERPCVGTPAAGPAELPAASQHQAPAWPCSQTRSPDGHSPASSDHSGTRDPKQEVWRHALPFLPFPTTAALLSEWRLSAMELQGPWAGATAARTINDTAICKCPGCFGDLLWGKSSQSLGSHELLVQLLCPMSSLVQLLTSCCIPHLGDSSNLAERDIREVGRMKLTCFRFLILL